MVMVVMAFCFAVDLVAQSVSICRSALLMLLPIRCHLYLDTCKSGCRHRIRPYACLQAADSRPTQTSAAVCEKRIYQTYFVILRPATAHLGI
jgi:hypothetical protein